MVVGEEDGDEMKVDGVNIWCGQEEIAEKRETLGRRYREKQDGEVGKV